MSETFQIVKWDNLITRKSYIIKNIEDQSTFTGEFILNNLDFIEGFEDETTKYVNFDEAPFNDDIENWKEYVNHWLISQNLDPTNPHISEPLYNLFGERSATPINIAEKINQVFAYDGGEAFFDFLNDPQFIIDAAHINNNISYDYDIIGVLFKNVKEDEIIDYKWFQIIRYKFSELSNINSNIPKINKKIAPSNFLEKKYLNIPKKINYPIPVSKIRLGGKTRKRKTRKNKKERKSRKRKTRKIK